MIREFSDRVISELERTGHWPNISQVIAAMKKIETEMEKEALENPIAPAPAQLSLTRPAVLFPGVEPVKTVLDEISDEPESETIRQLEPVPVESNDDHGLQNENQDKESEDGPVGSETEVSGTSEGNGSGG